MKVAVIGAGQAGSAIARAISGAGHSVVIADADADDVREVDACNPLQPDYSGLQVSERSGAEQVQDRLPSASVIKAFNTVFSNNHDQPVVEGVRLDGFVAGDDQAAKNTVADLLETIGFRPVDVGGLASALALEYMAFLNISLNARNDLPFRSGWKLVGPTETGPGAS